MNTNLSTIIRMDNRSVLWLFVGGLEFFHVNPRWPGSANNVRILRLSFLNNAFDDSYRPFPGAVILEDSVYPTRSKLILHLPGNVIERFNEAHKNTKATVERASAFWNTDFQFWKRYGFENSCYAAEIIKCVVKRVVSSLSFLFWSEELGLPFVCVSRLCLKNACRWVLPLMDLRSPPPLTSSLRLYSRSVSRFGVSMDLSIFSSGCCDDAEAEVLMTAIHLDLQEFFYNWWYNSIIDQWRLVQYRMCSRMIFQMIYL